MSIVTMDSKQTKERYAINLAKKQILSLIYKTANVSGLDVSLDTVTGVFDNIPVTITKDQMLYILNMRNAYNFLLNNLQYNNCFMLLREFNKICGAELIYDAGTVRTFEIDIDGTRWKPQITINEEIFDTIHELNQIKDPVEKALEYFCYISRAKIFCDGNMRVGQLMANKILIENNIGILSVPTELTLDFRILLVEFYETGDNTKLRMFLKDNCIEYI